MKYLANLYHFIYRLYRRLTMILLKFKFKRTGSNFIFDPFGVYSYETIEIGDDVYIGLNPTLLATESKIIFGNKIMLGPNVTIMGGDHNTNQIGKYMFDVKTKLPENDLPVIIQDDVWIGSGATILKGVTIGEGSIVAACSLVIKDIPPYTVVGGVPAKILKKRFTEEEILKHKELLNVRN